MTPTFFAKQSDFRNCFQLFRINSMHGHLFVKSIKAFLYTTLFLLLFIVPAHNQEQKRVDIMTYEEVAKTPHSFPYIIELRTGKGALLYFGAQHSNDPKHPQNEQIQQLWKSFRPTIAFNEGGDPPTLKAAEEAISKFGETGLVRFLAARDNVPVRSLEPSRGEEVATLLKSYTPEQLKVFYALRQILGYRRGKNNETLDERIEFTLKWLSSVPGLERAPRTVAELGESSTRLLPKLKDWHEVPDSWFDPGYAQPLSYLNEVSRASNRFRDEYMVNLLVNEVKQGRRVFAVVGGSHVVMQERALRAMLESKCEDSFSSAPHLTTDSTGARLSLHFIVNLDDFDTVSTPG
jgi:hypothetical protein